MRDPLVRVLVRRAGRLGVAGESDELHRLAFSSIAGSIAGSLLFDARPVCVKLNVDAVRCHALPHLGHERPNPGKLGFAPLLECLERVAVACILRSVCELALNALRIGRIVPIGLSIPAQEVLLPLIAVAHVVNSRDIATGIAIDVPLRRLALIQRGMRHPLVHIIAHVARWLLVLCELRKGHQGCRGLAGVCALGGLCSLLLRDAGLVSLELVIHSLRCKALERLGHEGVHGRQLSVPPLLEVGEGVAVAGSCGSVAELFRQPRGLLLIVRVLCSMLAHEALPPPLRVTHVVDRRDPITGIPVDVPCGRHTEGLSACHQLDSTRTSEGAVCTCVSVGAVGAWACLSVGSVCLGVGAVRPLHLRLDLLLKVHVLSVQTALRKRLPSLWDVFLDPGQLGVVPRLEASQRAARGRVPRSRGQHRAQPLPLELVAAVLRRVLLQERVLRCGLPLSRVAHVADLGDPRSSVPPEVLLRRSVRRRQRLRLRGALRGGVLRWGCGLAGGNEDQG
mmetsp:Transcript_96858/g.283150  ORF Transcript_96858/g.283150 Transcript_96858/m.283150 type:complete len:508 (-) Transcript_96858:100-1623(-)